MNTRPQSRPEAELPEMGDDLLQVASEACADVFDGMPGSHALALRAALQAAYGQQCAATRQTVTDSDVERAMDASVPGAEPWKVVNFMGMVDNSCRPVIRAALESYAATRSAEVGGDGWLPIESAPVGAHEVVALISVDGPNGYVTDPWTGWINGDGSYSRWPHEFPPTHWKSLGPRPTKNMGSEVKS